MNPDGTMDWKDREDFLLELVLLDASSLSWRLTRLLGQRTNEMHRISEQPYPHLCESSVLSDLNTKIGMIAHVSKAKGFTDNQTGIWRLKQEKDLDLEVTV